MLTSLTPELNPNDQIQFADFHRVSLEAGDYQMRLGQLATVDGTSHWFPGQIQNFTVKGERFQLDSTAIHSVFPPPNSRGEFWNVIPHIVLERSTLPWERTCLEHSIDPAVDTPWLGILVFRENEAPVAKPASSSQAQLSTTTLATLEQDSSSSPIWNSVSLESAQHSSDQVQVIDVPAGLLQTLLPSTTRSAGFDLQYHVRRRLSYIGPISENKTLIEGLPQTTMPDGSILYRDLKNHIAYETLPTSINSTDLYQVATETAGVLGNRLPMPNQRNVVHLVSLEGLYSFKTLSSSLSITVDSQATTINFGEAKKSVVSSLKTLLPDGGMIRLTFSESYISDIVVRLVSYSSNTEEITVASPISYERDTSATHPTISSGTVTAIAYLIPNWNAGVTAVPSVSLSVAKSKLALTGDTSGFSDMVTPCEAIISDGTHSQQVRVSTMTSDSVTINPNTPISDSISSVTAIHYNANTYRLVSLYNWEFFCEDPQKNFEGILLNLNGARTIPVSNGALTPQNVIQQSYLSTAYPLSINKNGQWMITNTSTNATVGYVSPNPGCTLSNTAILKNGTIEVNSAVATTFNGTIHDYLANTSYLVASGVVTNKSDLAGPYFSTTALTVGSTGKTIQSGSSTIGRILTSAWDTSDTIASGVVKKSKTIDSTLNATIQDISAEVPPTFRLPFPDSITQSTVAKTYLEAGFIPLKHQFRQGGRSVSWYHGPLVVRENEVYSGQTNLTDADLSPLLTVPAQTADSLLVFDQTSGMFDASWAAAWELGRQLMLQNTPIATQLYEWKKRNTHSLNSARYLADYGYQLPTTTSPTGVTSGLPAAVDQWFNDLTLLAHVPFNYLVSNPDLLPPESLRFFRVDRGWLTCLRDGAYSIGRVESADGTLDQIPLSFGSVTAQEGIPQLSGVLIRSEAISGWGPKINISAPKNTESYYTLLRLEQLSPSIMIAIFEGDITSVDVHIRAEQVHFGFDIDPSTPITFDPATDSWTSYIEKRARTRYGKIPQTQSSSNTASASDLKSAFDPTSRTIIWDQLVGSLATPMNGAQSTDTITAANITTAAFTLQMVAGVESVTFKLPPLPTKS